MNSRQLFPPPETGVHSWLFGRAVHLRGEGLDQHTAVAELSRHVASCTFRAGRSVSEGEITEAVSAAFRSTTLPRGSRSVVSPIVDRVADYSEVTGWPVEMPLPRVTVNAERLASVLTDAGGFELADIWEMGAIRPPETPSPRWAMNRLFSETDILCIGRSSSSFEAKPLSAWSNDELLGAQFIVPNPLRKTAGDTKAGGLSAHCRDATGPRRYIVVESDTGLDPDQQAKVIHHLVTVTKADLAAVVLSGGKSVHAWFRCDSVPSRKLHKWFSYAVSLGADPRLWLPEQFVRLPDGKRENGKRQSVLFAEGSK